MRGPQQKRLPTKWEGGWDPETRICFLRGRVGVLHVFGGLGWAHLISFQLDQLKQERGLLGHCFMFRTSLRTYLSLDRSARRRPCWQENRPAKPLSQVGRSQKLAIFIIHLWPLSLCLPARDLSRSWSLSQTMSGSRL